jgi:hypothetical protein
VLRDLERRSEHFEKALKKREYSKLRRRGCNLLPRPNRM